MCIFLNLVKGDLVIILLTGDNLIILPADVLGVVCIAKGSFVDGQRALSELFKILAIVALIRNSC